ncbi:MAG: nuclear transport factor 2 family protein [Pseudomonadales bacterium]|nr:nuclear transport factor 2 family protein [Pseudomonadales bacterium]
MKYNLQQISDRLEIKDLIIEYASAVDAKDFDRLDTLFTHDAEIDYSAFGGAKGNYPEVKQFLQDSLPVFKNYQHMIGNSQIKLDGDKATGEVMCFNPMELQLESDQPSNIFFLGFWYIDEYLRVDGSWRISKRKEIKSYDFNTPDFINFDGL